MPNSPQEVRHRSIDMDCDHMKDRSDIYISVIAGLTLGISQVREW